MGVTSVPRHLLRVCDYETHLGNEISSAGSVRGLCSSSFLHVHMKGCEAAGAPLPEFPVAELEIAKFCVGPVPPAAVGNQVLAALRPVLLLS